MLPPAHIAYTWLATSIAQEYLHAPKTLDYRLITLAAIGSDLIDKPLAWLYFYERYRSAVLFAHTLLFYLLSLWITLGRFPRLLPYTTAFIGHALLDRIWFFPDTFYWPLRGWRFQIWRKEGSEQKKMGKAYWYAFTRRPELWGWEVGALLALLWFIGHYRLDKPSNLLFFLCTGRPSRP